MKIATLLACLASTTAIHGQGVAMKSYSQITPNEPRKAPVKIEKRPLTFDELDGKNIWFVPNPKKAASKRVGFSKTSDAGLDDMVYPEAPVRLYVKAVTEKATGHQLQVVFPDGTTFFMHCQGQTMMDSVKLESITADDITPDQISYFDYKLKPMASLDASDQETIFITDPAVLRAKLEEARKIVQAEALEGAEDSQEEARARNAAREKAIARQPAELRNVIRSHKIKLGMTPEQVTLAWGRPQDINRTTTLGGTREQWVYGLKTYVYFQGGVVTTIQN